MAMRGQGRGFGLIVLLIVAAIVLLLATRNWKAVMPSVRDVTDSAGAVSSSDETGSETTSDTPPSGTTAPAHKPIQSNLRETRAKTGAHSDEIRKALQDPSN